MNFELLYPRSSLDMRPVVTGMHTIEESEQ